MLSFLKQCAVLSDLLFQAGLDAQEHLVLLVLTLYLTADAGQLLLQGADHVLDLLQLQVVATFCVFQVGLQRVDLQMETKYSVYGNVAGLTHCCGKIGDLHKPEKSISLKISHPVSHSLQMEYFLGATILSF